MIDILVSRAVVSITLQDTIDPTELHVNSKLEKFLDFFQENISNTIHVIKHRFVLCTACFSVLRVGKSSKYIAFSRL